MYQNPFESSINIELPDPKEGPFICMVYDVVGNEVLSVPSVQEKSFTLDWKNLPKGLFYLVLKNDKKMYRGKIIAC